MGERSQGAGESGTIERERK